MNVSSITMPLVFLVRIVAIVLLLAPLYFSCFVHALAGTIDQFLGCWGLQKQ
jgi:hypothetical protein